MKQILSYLQTVEGTHVTVADICCFFKEQGITIGTTTVYRNLEKMVEQGMVAKYNVDGTSSACFEYLGADEHCHKTSCFHCKCEKCGKLIHLPHFCTLHRYHKKQSCTDPSEIRGCPSDAAPV